MKSFFLSLDRLGRLSRLLIAVVLAAFIYVLVKFSGGSTGIPFLSSWLTFASVLLFFTWTTFLVQHPKQTGLIAQQLDASVWIIFLVVLAAAFISLLAILLLLRSLPTVSKTGLSIHIVLSIISVALSWILIHSLFTMRYAHLYYDLTDKRKGLSDTHAGGLDFPAEKQPDFLDFAYFSFVVGMTFQTADISITSQRIRRLALLHGFLSFIYNTAIIALSINIVSGLIGK